ncbi:bifunctional 2-polyprenyl-6-hydroxyphenol methylase/3-demethylubiquinol 3-O-methyltransferase UbiG [Pseudomonas sp. H9]|uniref:class I SAM-dependent methyltransferase n=1 Tax=Pseudomonas sp. H9 TaxID=483968 RepID=UPI001057F2D0|nr:class I SAM-dependent methyltransferase [Pseudomonas sp. H9]TDF84398.1 class I SAM-dependent methyltransferase [Pseudomonas sp. H9]
MPTPETSLVQSWQHNAEHWIDAVREGAIDSRLQVTDQAILLAVLSRQPARVLDLGCGEGWLLRALSERGIEAVGVDGEARLVDAARAAGSAQVHLASYDALVEETVDVGRDYPLICANFALLQQDIIPLLSALNALLAPGGALVIQTLHPWAMAAGNYQDGWREEHFTGLKGHWQPMPWYFRTLSSWLNALDMAGFTLSALQEPQHPQSPGPQSLLLIAEKIASNDYNQTPIS